MGKFIKAIQCRNCGKIVTLDSLEKYCPNCSESTGLEIYGSQTEQPTVKDIYFGNYRIFYDDTTMKTIIAKKRLFGKLKYVREVKENE